MFHQISGLKIYWQYEFLQLVVLDKIYVERAQSQQMDHLNHWYPMVLIALHQSLNFWKNKQFRRINKIFAKLIFHIICQWLNGKITAKEKRMLGLSPPMHHLPSGTGTFTQWRKANASSLVFLSLKYSMDNSWHISLADSRASLISNSERKCFF